VADRPGSLGGWTGGLGRRAGGIPHGNSGRLRRRQPPGPPLRPRPRRMARQTGRPPGPAGGKGRSPRFGNGFDSESGRPSGVAGEWNPFLYPLPRRLRLPALDRRLLRQRGGALAGTSRRGSADRHGPRRGPRPGSDEECRFPHHRAGSGQLRRLRDAEGGGPTRRGGKRPPPFQNRSRAAETPPHPIPSPSRRDIRP